VIIASTTPGKGVSFMENKWEWHGKKLSKEESEMAIKELKNA
jgi:transketolase